MSTNDALSMDVLVVDDEAMVCKVAARILKGNGHTVRIAHDGLEALEHFKGASLPDAVLLDVNMPRMDGPTCFESIRELYPEMPVVFVSGGADTALRKRMIDAGASAFLLKPFQAADLIDALRDACSGCAVVLKD